jgi:DNA-binding response OmpR family regulator
VVDGINSWQKIPHIFCFPGENILVKCLRFCFLKGMTMSQNRTAPKKPKQILIVEDEGDMCLLLNIILSQKGISLDHVKTITAANDFLQGNEPTIVILDNKLPDGYGIDYINTIKKTHPSTKVVMISALGASRDIALSNGADLFLEKPFTKEVLCKSVQELMA